MNVLYYGDNLDILRRYIADESVDLIYLDPPFNSNRSYNVLFREVNGVTESAAQIRAFEDTWQWDAHTEATFHEIARTCPPRLVDMLNGFVGFLGRNEMTAYLVMMAIRLVELHRVLKRGGTLYLHCDPVASHYLKIVLDQIFGKGRMVNEIIWKRTTTKSDYKQGAVNWPRVHDVILMYRKAGGEPVFNQPFGPYDQEYIENFYRYTDEKGRRYSLDNLAAPGRGTRGHPRYEFLGVTRYWRYSKEKMEELYREGRIVQSRPGAVPRYKRYLDEMPGVPISDVWDDIPPVQGQSKEFLGYQTQKPVALLERIIEASSNPGDVVLDPFCGCGTTIAAAQKLGRTWIGIDITHLAINLIKNRLRDMYPDCQFTVIGEPQDEAGARELAAQDRHQFEYWALALVGARPARGEPKKGADTGIDGVLYTIDDPRQPPRKVVVQVKSGKVSVAQVRDFRAVIEREKAAIGLFLTLDPPTQPMLTEAAAAGVYEHALKIDTYPRLQILTIGDLLAGRKPLLPSVRVTFRTAEKAPEGGTQLSLDMQGGEAEE